MRRGFAIVSLCFAWICANGAIWDAVQVLAWGRMFAGYTQTASFLDALRDTFDTSKPCAICRTVSNAKAGDHRPELPAPSGSAPGKIILATESPVTWVTSTPQITWPEAKSIRLRARTEPVPVRPPRA